MFEPFNPDKNGDLSRLNRIRVGGKADYIIQVRSKDELVKLYNICGKRQIRLIPLGHGTNVFFTDGRLKAVVALISFSGITLIDGNTIRAGAGASFADLQEFSFQHSLSGLEFFSGIPGTVGGAVAGNAGAYGLETGGFLCRAEILTKTGKLVTVGKDFFEFGYRDSSLKKNGLILTEADFKLCPGDREEIRKKSREVLEIRKRKLPPEDLPTAGSYFKNLCSEGGERKPAARLLDAVGAKSCQVGDAAVFKGHANIIYNRGRCTARELLELERVLVGRVKDKFGITLQREVVYFA